jgi:hypothetical protein
MQILDSRPQTPLSIGSLFPLTAPLSIGSTSAPRLGPLGASLEGAAAARLPMRAAFQWMCTGICIFKLHLKVSNGCVYILKFPVDVHWHIYLKVDILASVG